MNRAGPDSDIAAVPDLAFRRALLDEHRGRGTLRLRRFRPEHGRLAAAVNDPVVPLGLDQRQVGPDLDRNRSSRGASSSPDLFKPITVR